MSPRVEAAVALLKQCKAQGKTYYEATQTLSQQGYTQVETEQASYQFPYTDVPPPTIDSNNAQDSIPQQRPNTIHETSDETELQEAKQLLKRESWYSLIPIVGAFYRYKQILDYTKYESLKTGRRQSLVLFIWIVAMIIAAFIALVAAPQLASLFSKSGGLLYASHYVGLIVAALLLVLTLRIMKKRS